MKAPSQLTQAILWMLCLSFCSSSVSVCSRLANGTLHPFQLVFFMMLIGLMAQLLPSKKRDSLTFKNKPHKLYLLRSAFEVVGFTCSFYAVRYMSLPMFSAMSYLLPLFISTAAVIVFREKTTWHTWSALFFGIVGVFIIIRPSGETEFLGPILMICMCSSFTITGIAIKVLTKTQPNEHIVFFMFLYTTLLSAPLAIYNWMPIGDGIYILLALGAFSIFQQIGVTAAFSKAPLSFLMPITFSTLVFTTLYANQLFDEQLDFYTFVGAVIILGSACFSTIKNSRHAATSN